MRTIVKRVGLLLLSLCLYSCDLFLDEPPPGFYQGPIQNQKGQVSNNVNTNQSNSNKYIILLQPDEGKCDNTNIFQLRVIDVYQVTKVNVPITTTGKEVTYQMLEDFPNGIYQFNCTIKKQIKSLVLKN